MTQEQKRQSISTLLRAGMSTKGVIKVNIASESTVSLNSIACKNHPDVGEDPEATLRSGCSRKLDTDMVVEAFKEQPNSSMTDKAMDVGV